jgi:hypothetical protein
MCKISAIPIQYFRKEWHGKLMTCDDFFDSDIYVTKTFLQVFLTK